MDKWNNILWLLNALGDIGGNVAEVLFLKN
jgi:hypothetical protein